MSSTAATTDTTDTRSTYLMMGGLDEADMAALFAEGNDFDTTLTPSDPNDLRQIRFTIVKLVEHNTSAPSFKYTIRNENTMETSTLILKDGWGRDTLEIRSGTIIHLVGVEKDFDGNKYVVERNRGYMIIDPDRLISVTNVVNMNWCDRKTTFTEFFRFAGSGNIHTLEGTIAHELLNQAMAGKLISRNDIKKAFQNIIVTPEVLDTAYEIGMTQKNLQMLEDELIEPVLSFMSKLNRGEENVDPSEPRFVTKGDRQKFMKLDFHKTNKDEKLKILSVQDIEDCYWSPTYGLKGKVDCTVDTLNSFGERAIIPMEFKTGRKPNPKFPSNTNRSEHRGQVYLYSLMMDKLNLVGPCGILYYIKEMHLHEVRPPTGEIQSLIMARNRIVQNIIETNSGDGFSNVPRASGANYDVQCKRCEYKTFCTLSTLTSDDGEKDGPDTRQFSKLESQLHKDLSYLGNDDRAFFKKWSSIIKYEMDDDETNFNTKNLWLKPVVKRERDGNCIGFLTIISQTQSTSGSSALITFALDTDEKQILSLNFTEKDFVIVGTANAPNVGYAVVETINESSIVVSMERQINGRHGDPNTKFSIEKVSSSSINGTQLSYLSDLMENNPIANRLREYLIGNREPVVGKLKKTETGPEFYDIIKSYNVEQKTTIYKAILTDSLLLVSGSPGCGKTTTIIGLIRILTLRKKTVLISAYTSNALDNILLAYKKHSDNFIRIGSGGKLNEEELRPYSTAFLRTQYKDVDKLAEFYESKPVVGTTLLSLKHPIFSQKKFDYCIVDEGSQAFPTVIIGAMLHAEKWIVFGDPNQLPTVIKSPKIKAMKIPDNLFSLLRKGSEVAPKIASLNIQYRMNNVIMAVPNNLVYENVMKCGSPGQANRTLLYSSDKAKDYLHSNYPATENRTWLCLAASRKQIRSVMFLDTELLEAYDTTRATSLQNFKEASIVMAFTNFMINSGISQKDIGIIAPYRGQVNLIRDLFGKLELHVEVNTVDQYQGREKQLIILSFTKSIPMLENNDPNRQQSRNEESSILNDVRRINVAITRAQTKVVLIGNSSTLNMFAPCKNLLMNLDENQKHKLKAADFSQSFFTEQ